MKGRRMEEREVLEALEDPGVPEVLEAARARIERIKAQEIANAIAQSGEEMQGVEEANLTLAEVVVIMLEKAIGAILNELCAYREPLTKREEGKDEFLNFRTAWGRKEAREKQKSDERAAASRFRQYNARKTARTTQKRTGPRCREWHGPWRAKKE